MVRVMLTISAFETAIFTGVGGYLVYSGIKYFTKSKSSTWRAISITQVAVGLFLMLSMILVWSDKKVSFNFLGVQYHGPISMALLFILIVIILIVVKDILKERMKIIKANVWMGELENRLKQEYDKKHSCFTHVDKVKYILDKYLSNIEDVIFNRNESYAVHCYKEKISNLDEKALKEYNFKEMKKELDNLL